jgi:hypothetical protein
VTITSMNSRPVSVPRRGPGGPVPLVPAALALVLVSAWGCGKPPMHQVQGVVRIGGKPVEGCKVGFFPDATSFDPTRHGFGFGITDADGKYVIQHPQGEAGIWAGNYKVTLVAWVNKKGEPLPPDIKPSEVEGGVRNLFPDAYEAPSTTPERAAVRKGEPNEFSFDVPAAGPRR